MKTVESNTLNEDIDLSSILSKSQNKNQKNKKENTSLEESISNILKSK